MSETKDWNSFLKLAREVEADYFREVEKTKKLSSELEIIKVEYERLYKKYLDENKRARELESKLGEGERAEMLPDSRIIELQKQLNSALKDLREEAERLKTTYPVFDLLAAKQAEVDRMKKALANVDREHPDRKVIESMVKAHILERDELKRIVQEAEGRLQNQLDKIHSSYLVSSRGPAARPDSDSFESSPKPTEWIRVPEH